MTPLMILDIPISYMKYSLNISSCAPHCSDRFGGLIPFSVKSSINILGVKFVWAKSGEGNICLGNLSVLSPLVVLFLTAIFIKRLFPWHLNYHQP